MSNPERTPHRRLLLVERDGRAGLVLERALAAHGWSVTRIESGRAVSPYGALCNVALLVLDHDDPDIFEALTRLASLPRPPSVVLLTHRAFAHSLEPRVLDSLGIDRVIEWPCHVDQIAAALETAPHQPLRLVS